MARISPPSTGRWDHPSDPVKVTLIYILYLAVKGARAQIAGSGASVLEGAQNVMRARGSGAQYIHCGGDQQRRHENQNPEERSGIAS